MTSSTLSGTRAVTTIHVHNIGKTISQTAIIDRVSVTFSRLGNKLLGHFNLNNLCYSPVSSRFCCSVLQSMTLDVIGRCAFGLQTHAQVDKEDMFLVKIRNLFKAMTKTKIEPLLSTRLFFFVCLFVC